MGPAGVWGGRGAYYPRNAIRYITYIRADLRARGGSPAGWIHHYSSYDFVSWLGWATHRVHDVTGGVARVGYARPR